MNPSANKETQRVIASNVALWACGIAQTLIFVLVCALSYYFQQERHGADRPLILVLSLFGISFLFYAWAWKTVGGFSAQRFARQSCSTGSLLIVIFFGLVFRAVMLPSIPIQEIDIYRYIWDGGVVTTGTDPYLYSPETILKAVDQTKVPSNTMMTETPAKIPLDMQPVIKLVDQRPGLRYALGKTHFGHYTSPYPPVSQFVFGTTISLVPTNASHNVYLYAMKGALLLFDIGTGFVIVLLLGHLGLSRLLSLGYWWCPLTIKEFANSGHLDSIVIFFATLAVYFFARAFWSNRPAKNNVNHFSQFNWRFAIGSAMVLGVSIAAKIVPVVLVPIGVIVSLRRGFFGTIVLALVLGVTTIVLIWPMARHLESTRILFERFELEIPFAEKLSDEPQGIEAFSKYWEMNDFIFMLLVENFKPEPANATSSDRPWFAITSNEFRRKATEAVAERNATLSPAKLPPQHPSFSISRKITLAIFGLCVLGCCVSVFRNMTLENVMEKAFLTIAWFWLLAPTQNPWYWMWALPLLPLAKGRVWFWMSGLLFLYYLRFWFDYHFTGIPVLQTPYTGTSFFDYVIPWVEFAPWLCVLFFCWVFRCTSSPKRVP